MKLTFKLLIFLHAISFQSESLFAQDSLSLLQISKISNANKVKQIDPNSYFKVKPHEGKKLKAKFASVGDDFIITTINDTIYFGDIKWIKLKMKISGFEKTAAITGVFAGSYLSFATVPAAIYFIVVEGVFWPLIPATTTLSAAVIGYKTLAGRRYYTKKWKFETSTQLN
jgi:hypothetical protein